jgi:hypothetical protein
VIAIGCSLAAHLYSKDGPEGLPSRGVLGSAWSPGELAVAREGIIIDLDPRSADVLAGP